MPVLPPDRFDKSHPRPQNAATLGVFYQRHGHAIFHAAARISHFQLGENASGQTRSHAR